MGQNDGLLYSVTSTELKFRCLKTTCHTHHYLMQRDEEMTPSASRPSFYLLFKGSKTRFPGSVMLQSVQQEKMT